MNCYVCGAPYKSEYERCEWAVIGEWHICTCCGYSIEYWAGSARYTVDQIEVAEDNLDKILEQSKISWELTHI